MTGPRITLVATVVAWGFVLFAIAYFVGRSAIWTGPITL